MTRSSPLTRAEAQARAIPDRELASAQWRRPHHGIHTWHGTDPFGPRLRIDQAALALPVGGAITGWAACFVHGAHEMDGLRPDRTALPVTVCTPPPIQMRNRRGIVILRSALDEDEIDVVDGLLVTTPVRACFDVIRKSSLPDAVAAVDVMLRCGLVTLGDLNEYVARRPRWRGLPLVRKVLVLADPRSRSCAESRFRVLWIVEATLPRPLVNVRVFDLRRQLLGEVDLFDEEAALVGEYDGSDHRSLVQHTADNAREEELERHGLIVVRATSLDLGPFRQRTIMRLRSDRTRGLARDRRRDRWTLDVPSE